MLRLLLLFLLFLGVSGYGQQDQLYFSEAITLHLPKYKKHADKAYRDNDIERAEFLFDSLVDYSLKGSKMDDFRIQNLKKNIIFLNKFIEVNS